jgi:hypothetical protein
VADRRSRRWRRHDGELRRVRVSIASVRWLRLDINTVTTVHAERQKPPEIGRWVEGDLSKVDEIRFADLIQEAAMAGADSSTSEGLMSTEHQLNIDRCQEGDGPTNECMVSLQDGHDWGRTDDLCVKVIN